MQEIDNQKAHHRIEELERTKQRLEQEVHVSRKRLEVEALAAKQVISSECWWGLLGGKAGIFLLFKNLRVVLGGSYNEPRLQPRRARLV